jgi:hypothetical protein
LEKKRTQYQMDRGECQIYLMFRAILAEWNSLGSEEWRFKF